MEALNFVLSSLKIPSELPVSSATDDNFVDAASSPISKTTMESSLDSAALQKLHTPEAKELHSLMKELGRMGVGHIIDLPRIVVFGRQSAGKSSVLEAISRIRFPVKEDLCTRFATELELESDTKVRIHASIKDVDANKIKPLDNDAVSESDLPGIIQQATSEMKLLRPGKQFYNDVLMLNIKVPGQSSLRLVDLPGIFAVPSHDQTPEDINTVDMLVDSYLTRKNTIIMLVIAADTDFGHQKILDKVKEYKEYQNRTIGIITKPDIGETRRYHAKYIELAQNKQIRYNLKLGWHVLRNRDTTNNEDDFEERDAAETRFFSTKNSSEISWSDVKRSDWGVQSLREKLSKIQFEHQRNCFPAVTRDIRVKLAEREEELDRMGPERPNIEDVRDFLRGKAVQFQMLAKSAVEGRYNEAFFRRLPDPYKLRAQICRFNAAFDYTMRLNGAMETIVGYEGVTAAPPKLRSSVEDFLKVYPYSFPSPKDCSFDSVRAKLNKHAASHRGRELPGTTNGVLAFELFQEQSSKWEQIAQHHIDLVTAYSKDFVTKALEFLIGPAETNHTTAAMLRNTVFDFFKKREQDLQEKLKELIQPYKNGFALPADEDFLEYKYMRSKEATARLQHQIQSQQSAADDGSITISGSHLGSILSQVADRDEDEFAPGKILNTMQAYYELSRRTFTDNIINLAVEACLVRHIESIFTTDTVRKMNDAKIMEIAAESESVKAEREVLEKQRDILQKALEFCTRREPFNTTAQEQYLSPSPEETVAPKTQSPVTENDPFSTQVDLGAEASKLATNSTASALETAPDKTHSNKQPNPTPPGSVHGPEILLRPPVSGPISPPPSTGSSVTSKPKSSG